MLSLHYCVIFPLFLITLTGVSCQHLTPVRDEESTLEGSTVSLSYSYHTAVDPADHFFWYRQYPGNPPEFLLDISGLNRSRPADSPKSSTRFSTKLIGGKHLALQISFSAVTDSAVYYCAVRPNTQGGYKLYFGDGTRLTIETENEYQPSYYKLEEKVDDKTLCLATGFSRHNATSTHEGYKGLFNSSSAIRIKDDSLYNQVIFTDDDGKNCEHGPSVGDCETNLKGDEMVNLVSLTVTGLRVIFIKTIIFNILMTLRLWLSQ
ncbi:T cell receptor alpha chain MC.7.G5-like isoform 1-T1 [Pholidichthys leucotaenia]